MNERKSIKAQNLKERIGVVEIFSELQEVLRVLNEAPHKKGQPLTLKLHKEKRCWKVSFSQKQTTCVGRRRELR